MMGFEGTHISGSNKRQNAPNVLRRAFYHNYKCLKSLQASPTELHNRDASRRPGEELAE